MKIETPTIKSLFFENGTYKLVALFITLVLWITFLGRREGVYTNTLNLEYLPSDGLVIANEVADEVEVRVSGPQMRLKKARETLQGALTVDLTGYSRGQFPVKVPIERLQLPFGTKIVSVSPERVNIKLDVLESRFFDIEPVWTKKPGWDWEVMAISPTQIRLKGASSSLQKIVKIKTRPIDTVDLKKRHGEKNVELNAVLEKVDQPGVLPFSEQSVVVYLRSKRKVK